jgi:hypothetical protein
MLFVFAISTKNELLGNCKNLYLAEKFIKWKIYQNYQ